MEDKIVEIDSKRYPFEEELKKLFEINELSKLHEDCDLEPFINADLGRDSNSIFHSKFYMEIKKEGRLKNIWDEFCHIFIREQFPGEERLIIQALPNIRIHVPGAQAVKRWHSDADKDHNHPLGEINAIIAVTEMFGNNSVWRESSPGEEDYKPFLLKKYQTVFWNGNTCMHGNKVNDTGKTRISLNFRVIPHKSYVRNVEESSQVKESATRSTKFSIGNYYRELKK